MIDPTIRLFPNFERLGFLVDNRLWDVVDLLFKGKASWPLFLHGPQGCGKTCAALAACDIAETASFWSVDTLCDQIFDLDVDPWVKVREKDLVVLDDVGTRSTTEFQYQAVKRFADEREMQRRGVAIYTSNLDPEELSDAFDDRVASRILCGTVFELKAVDRRFER